MTDRSGRAIKEVTDGGVKRGLQHQATWAPALRNIQSVYLTYYPALAFPGAAAQVGAFADLAVATGARRLVLLSLEKIAA